MADDTASYTRLVLFSTLAITVVGAVYVQYDAQKMKRALKTQADMLVNEFTAESDDDAVDAIATVTATRKYILFGEPRGKITVYLRNNHFEENASEAHDENTGGDIHDEANTTKPNSNQIEEDTPEAHDEITGDDADNPELYALTRALRDAKKRNGKKKYSHTHNQKYSGVEYLFTKEEGNWLNTESGQCSEKSCQIAAKQAFDTPGI